MRAQPVSLPPLPPLGAADPHDHVHAPQVSDDLGWNDVSFHGSEQIGTPHIDVIAKEGVALYNYHIQPVCSPTRSTILSGRHVIHTGLYMPFAQGTNLRLGLNYTLLPALLKKLGYSTHMVGKWCVDANFQP